jgi:hypothetical protein
MTTAKIQINKINKINKTNNNIKHHGRYAENCGCEVGFMWIEHLQERLDEIWAASAADLDAIALAASEPHPTCALAISPDPACALSILPGPHVC